MSPKFKTDGFRLTSIRVNLMIGIRLLRNILLWELWLWGNKSHGYGIRAFLSTINGKSSGFFKYKKTGPWDTHPQPTFHQPSTQNSYSVLKPILSKQNTENKIRKHVCLANSGNSDLFLLNNNKSGLSPIFSLF